MTIPALRIARRRTSSSAVCFGRMFPTSSGKTSSEGEAVGLELHLVTEWGASIPWVAGEVGRHVRQYLGSMIELEPSSVAVVVDDVAAPPPQ